ncbi:hypothetical protein T484DRAFT_1838529, partial [Baffinella frigidus]
MESPADTALVHPRRKAGQAKLGRGTQAVLLTKRDLEDLMHLRLSEASKLLGLSSTTVKKVCRTLGIHKWNNTSFQEHCDDGHGSSPISKKNKPSLKEHTPDFIGVPAPLPATDVMHIEPATAPVKLEPSSHAASQSFLDEWRSIKQSTPSHTIQLMSCTSKPALEAAAQQRPSVDVATPSFSRLSSTSSEMPDSASSDIEGYDDFVSLSR